MYMSGILDRPYWARALAEDVFTAFDINIPTIDFFLPKRGKRCREIVGGHYLPNINRVQLLVNDNTKTDAKVWLVLHELGHSFVAQRYPKDICKRTTKKGKVVSNHHPMEFWETVVPWYIEYNVLDIALEKEYSKGIKFIKDYVGEI